MLDDEVLEVALLYGLLFRCEVLDSRGKAIEWKTGKQNLKLKLRNIPCCANCVLFLPNIVHS